MPFDRSKLPPVPPKEDLKDAAIRVFRTPVSDFVPKSVADHVPVVGQVLSKENRENFARPTLADADQQGSSLAENAEGLISQLLHGVAKHVPYGESFLGAARQATPHVREIWKDLAKTPFSDARQKGFISGALEGVTPSNITKATMLAGGVPGMVGGGLSGAEDAYTAFGDKNATPMQKIIGGIGAGVSALGLGHGALKMFGPGAKAAEEAAGAVPKPKVTGQAAALEAAERLRKDKMPYEPGVRSDAEIMADHNLVNQETLKNPGGVVALRVAKGGRPNVVKTVERPPSIAEENDLHTQANDWSDKLKSTDKLQKEFTQAVNNKNSSMDKAAKETEAYRKMRGAAEDANVKRDVAQQKVVDRAHGQAITEDAKRAAQAQKAANDAAAADVILQEGQAKKQADTVKELNQGFKDNADATKGLAKAQATSDKVVGKAQDQAAAEDLKRTDAGIKQSQAEFRQDEIDAFKRREGVAPGPESLTENVQGEGPIGEKQSLKRTFREVPPEEEEGPGGQNPGDSGGEPPAPKSTFNRRIAALNEANGRPGGPAKWNVVKSGDNLYDVVERGPAGEPTPKAPVTPDPSAPVPSGEDGQPMSRRDMFHGEIWPNQASAQAVANKYGLATRQAGPRGRWETYKPESMSAEPTPSTPPPDVAGPEAAGGVPVEPPPPTKPKGPTSYANFSPEPIVPVKPNNGDLSPREVSRMMDLQPGVNRPKLTPAETEEFISLKKRANGEAFKEVDPHVNPVGEKEPVLPGVEPVVNPEAKPLAEVPFALERPSAKVAKAKEAVNPLFEAQMNDLHPEVDDIDAARQSEKILPTGNGTLPAEPPAQPVVDPSPSTPASSGMGQLAQDLPAQAEGADPLPYPEGMTAPKGGVEENLADIPGNLSPAVHPLVSQNKLPSRPLPSMAEMEARARAVSGAQAPGAEPVPPVEPPPEAPLKVAPEPQAPEAAPQASAEPDLSYDEIDKLPPDQQESYLKKMVQKFMANQKGGSYDPTDQSGFSNSLAMQRMVTGGLGATYGYQQGDDNESRLRNALIGGGLGMFGPEILRGGREGLVKAYSAGTDKALAGMDIMNKLHNAGLLSPFSVFKKFAGDVGGLSLAALENKDKAGDLLRQFVTAEGLKNLKGNFMEGWNGSETDNVANGIENFFKKGPLSWNGRAMGGLTKATKGAMGEAGFTPEEQAYYTLTAKPKYAATKAIYSAVRGGPENPTTGAKAYGSRLLQHLVPFARIGVNRLERGFEYSPLGFLSSKGSSKIGDIDGLRKGLNKAGLGTAAMVGAYGATPDNFVKEHPIAASNIAAFAGPLGIPIIAAMAMKTANKDNPEGVVDWGKKAALASAAVGKDIPGFRLGEDITGRGFPEGFVRNYLSGYTNVTRPGALLENYLRDQPEADVSSPDLPGYQKYTNRMVSNVPLLQQTLPRKDAEGSGTVDPNIFIEK